MKVNPGYNTAFNTDAGLSYTCFAEVVARAG